MAETLTVEQLRAMAIEADAAAGNPQDSDDATKPEAAQPDDQKAAHDPEAPAQSAEDSERETPPDQPKVKAGERKEKEGQRLEKTWQAVNAEKAALAAERAELERLRAEAAQQPAPQTPQRPQGVADHTGRTAADYRDAAKQFRDEGEDELATLAEQRAEQMTAAEREAQEQQSVDQVKAAWMESVNKTLSAKPELKDPNTELSKAVQALIKTNPVFVHVPDGFAQAVEVAEAKLAAGRVAALETEAKELRKQLDEARKKLAPAGSGTSYGQPGSKNLDQLPAGRRKAALLEMAAALDAQSY